MFAIALVLSFTSPTTAAIRTWDGGGLPNSNWTNALNWDGDLTPPTSGDALLFAGGGVDTTNNIVGLNLDSMGFAGNSFTLRGNAVTITNGILDTSGLNTNLLILTLGASQSISNTASGAPLAINANITNNTFNLTVGGDGDVLLGGIVGGGSGGLTKEGVGLLRLGAANTFSGGLTVNAGSVQLGNAAGIPSGAGRGNVALAAGSLLDLAGLSSTLNGLSGGGTIDNLTGTAVYTVTVGANDASGSFSGIIQNSSGIVSLTKTGTNTLTLNGANTYSGATTISQGTLVLGASGSFASTTNITIASGAVFNASAAGGFTLDSGKLLSGGRAAGFANDIVGTLSSSGIITVFNSGAAGTLTINGGLTLNGGRLKYDLQNVTTAGNGVNDLIAINGAFNATTLTTIVPGLLSSGFAAGNYTLISGATSVSGVPGNLNMSLPRGQVPTFSASANSVFVSVSGTPAPFANLVWSGSTWDVQTSQSWLSNGIPDYFYDLDGVMFTDTGAGSVSVVDAVSPGSITISNLTGAYNFVGPSPIGGNGALTKHGSAQLMFSGPGNTYTGPTIMNGGELFLDFRTQPSVIPANNILYAGTATNTLTLSGGSQLTVQSGGGIQHRQHFSGLTVGNGVNQTFGPARTANDTLVVIYGPISRPSAGGVIQLNMVQREAGDDVGEWTSNPLGVIGGYAVWGAAPVTAWAAAVTNNPQVVFGVTNYWVDDYVHNANESGANAFLTNSHNVTVVAANVATPKTNITINSLRFLEANRTLTLVGTNTISNGGILSANGAGTATITGGAIPSGNGLDLIINQHNAAQPLVINSTILGNGGATNLTKAGAGLVALSSNNLYSGTTYILQGTLQLGNGGTSGSLANMGSILNSGTLAYRRSDNVTHSTALGGIGGLATFGTGILSLTPDLAYQGATTVGAGANLQIGNGGSTGSISNSPYINVGSGGKVIFNRSGALTYSGSITNVGSLAKAGTGALTLDGTLEYTGSTTVSNGTLALAGAATLANSPTIRVDAGATLNMTAVGGLNLNAAVLQTIGGNGNIAGNVTSATGTTIGPGASVGILTFNNDLALNGGKIIIEASSLTNDSFNVLGTLNLNSGTLQVSILGGTIANGTYKIFTTPTLNGSLNNLTVIGLPPTQDGVVSNTAPGVYSLVISATTAPTVVWRGDGAANLWNLNTSANWRSNGVAAVFLNNQFANFDDSGSNNVPVTLVGTLVPKAVTVNAAGNYTFAGNGKFTSSATLDKAGTGTLTVLTTNDNFGPASISAGTLQLGNGVSAGDIGSPEIANHAALVFNLPGDQSNFAVISGTGTVSKLDTNMLTLTANSTYTNLTTAKGTLRIGDGGLAGSLAGKVNLVADIADLGGGNFQTNPATLAFNRASGSINQTNVTGNGNLANLGSGTVTLTASNSYTGDTILGSGTSAGMIVQGVAGAIPPYGTIVGAAGNDALDLNGFNTTVSGLSGGGGFVGGSEAAGTVTLTIGVNGTNVGPFSGVLRNTTAGNGVLRVVKTGAGSQLLNGASTFTGGLRVENGEINLRGNNNAGGANANVIELAGGNFRMDNRNLANPINIISNNALWILENGASTWNGPLQGPTTHTLIVSNLANRPDIAAGFNASTFAGTLKWADDSSAGWRWNGGLGSTNITFDFGNGTGFFEPRNRGLAITYGALIGGPNTVLGGPNAPDQINSPNVHVIGHKNLNTLFEGRVQDSGPGNGGAPRLVAIRKVGSGNLTLSGTLAYTAGTTVSNGVLVLTNLAVFPAVSVLTNAVINGPLGITNFALTLAAPGILDVSAMTAAATPNTVTLGAEAVLQMIRGDGTIRGSLTTLGNSLLTPGFSIGTLTVTNAVNLSGATFMEIDRASAPNSDRVVANSITYGGTLVVTNIGGSLVTGDTFQLFSASTRSGTFASVTLPAGVTWTNKLAVDGTISVLSAMSTTPTNITFRLNGNSLNLSWPSSHIGWQLQTNSVSVAATNSWFLLAGSTVTNQVSLTVEPTKTNVFYRLHLSRPPVRLALQTSAPPCGRFLRSSARRHCEHPQ